VKPMAALQMCREEKDNLEADKYRISNAKFSEGLNDED